MAGLFRSWGYDTRIEEFRRPLPHAQDARPGDGGADPLHRRRSPSRRCRRTRPPARRAEQLPDLQRLLDRRRRHRRAGLRQLRRARTTTRSWTRRGIDVKGKIVIARYGGSWRGIKPKVAAEHGAVGCIIYSDPARRRLLPGRRLSRRAAGAPSTARSAARWPTCRSIPGDPLTPGVGATADAKRLARERGARRSPRSRCCRSPTPTPCRCSRALGGPMAPEAWRGALPITYHLGPGPAQGPPQARLRLEAGARLRRHRHAAAAPSGPTSG